ncbi:MAG: response regulator [Caulobacteraceae bacterium]|nr:response regulator [Caulobacteraceae bacterium]
MAQRVRAFDWSTTLGPISAWPASLKTTVGMMMHSPVPLVLLWGEDGIMIYNDAYSEFAGGRHPGLLGSKVREGWPEVADFNDNVMKVGLAGGTLDYHDTPLVLYRTGEPEQVFLDLYYSPIVDEAGSPQGVIAIVVETTERVLGERSVRESEQRLRFLNDLAVETGKLSDADEILAATCSMTARHLGVSICAYAHMDPDEDGFTIRGDWAAPGSRSIVGRYSLADFGSLAVRNLGAGEPLIINDNRAELPADEAAAFQAIGIGATICMPLVKDGRLTALMAVHHRQPHAWTPYELAMIREVTERSWAHVERVGAEAELRASHNALADLAASLEHRVEERTGQLMQAEEALRQSQKMEAVGQLTGGIAHDFNNLLTGISGSLELLEKRLAQGDLSSAVRYIGAARDAARRAASLTQRLLAFSRRQTLDPRSIQPNDLVQEMAELIQRSVGPMVELDVAAAPDLWRTRADPSQLENALLNLCINARDAMAPNGGRLRLITGNRSVGEAEARRLELPAGDYVRIEVSDNGSGMSEAVRARAFDPFYTTKPLGQGTGLGLSMVYGFARQSGGAVEIQTALGKGTTVTVLLPRHEGPVEAERREVSGEPGRSDGETVLLVDDEAMVRMLMSQVLEDAGYKVLEAVDGPSALEVLHSPAGIDLLVTDVGLPGGMNGRQVADFARVARPGLKVMFVTGYAETAVVRDGGLESGMEVMTKPFEIDAFAARVRGLIERPD